MRVQEPCGQGGCEHHALTSGLCARHELLSYAFPDDWKKFDAWLFEGESFEDALVRVSDERRAA